MGVDIKNFTSGSPIRNGNIVVKLPGNAATTNVYRSHNKHVVQTPLIASISGQYQNVFIESSTHMGM